MSYLQVGVWEDSNVKQPNPYKFGVWSLCLDAIYCALLGVAVAVGASSIAGVISLPERLLTTAGIVVVLWAGLVLWMLARLRLRTALRLVLA